MDMRVFLTVFLLFLAARGFGETTLTTTFLAFFDCLLFCFFTLGILSRFECVYMTLTRPLPTARRFELYFGIAYALKIVELSIVLSQGEPERML